MSSDYLEKSMATFFSEYSKILDGDYSDDYWSDMGIDEAVSVLIKFTDADWGKLIEQSPYETVSWQTRCAETMSDAPSDKAVPILLRLMLSNQKDTVEASIDSLNSIKQSGKTINFSDEQIRILEELSRSEGLIGRIARSFKF